MFNIVRDLISDGLDSKSNLIRRTTLVTCIPTVAVVCVIYAAGEALNDHTKETMHSLKVMYDDVKDLWEKPQN